MILIDFIYFQHFRYFRDFRFSDFDFQHFRYFQISRFSIFRLSISRFSIFSFFFRFSDFRFAFFFCFFFKSRSKKCFWVSPEGKNVLVTPSCSKLFFKILSFRNSHLGFLDFRHFFSLRFFVTHVELTSNITHPIFQYIIIRYIYLTIIY